MSIMMPIGAEISFGNERFPMGPEYADWAMNNHRQSLKRLMQRGGLSWCEAAAIVEGRRWAKMEDADAEAVVRAALASKPSGEC